MWFVETSYVQLQLRRTKKTFSISHRCSGRNLTMLKMLPARMEKSQNWKKDKTFSISSNEIESAKKVLPLTCKVTNISAGTELRRNASLRVSNQINLPDGLSS